MITAIKGFIEIVYPEKDVRTMINVSNIGYIYEGIKDGIPGVYLKLLVGGPNGDEIWCCCSYEDIKKSYYESNEIKKTKGLII